MEKYKRFTDKKATTENTKVVYNENGFAMFHKELVEALLEEHNRLWELENKIENGTLVDTKVKIGQRVFRRGFFKGEIDEYIVSNIILENGELKFHLKHDYDEHKTCYSVEVLDIEEIGKTVFLTKPMLKKKLKELKDK